MKNSYLFRPLGWILLFLIFSLSVFSQSLQSPVQIQGALTIEEMLDLASQQTGISFYYGNDEIHSDRIVAFHQVKILGDALDQAFAGKYVALEQVDDKYVLRRSETPWVVHEPIVPEVMPEVTPLMTKLQKTNEPLYDPTGSFKIIVSRNIPAAQQVHREVYTSSGAMQSVKDWIASLGDSTSEKEQREKLTVHAGFVYPVSSGGKEALHQDYDLSFHLLAGAQQSVQTAAFSGLANIMRQDGNGLQFAGVVNKAGENMDGVSFAGITNINRQSSGLLFAGITNIVQDTLLGAQAAGIVNRSTATTGVQIAGLVNWTGDLQGAQLAGFVNRARSVKGAQIGLINVADTVGGVSFGLFNFVKHGYNRVEVFGTETFHTGLNIKFGSHHFHNIIGAGVQYHGTNRALWGIGYGFGSALPLGPKWGLNTDLMAYHIQEEQGLSFKRLNLLSSFRLQFTYKITPHFECYFGPTFQVMVSEVRSTTEGEVFTKLPPYTVYEHTSNGYRTLLWPGGIFGFRF